MPRHFAAIAVALCCIALAVGGARASCEPDIGWDQSTQCSSRGGRVFCTWGATGPDATKQCRSCVVNPAGPLPENYWPIRSTCATVPATSTACRLTAAKARRRWACAR